MAAIPTQSDRQKAESIDGDRPTVLDLTQGVSRAWPATGDIALAIAAFLLQAALADAYYSLTTAVYGGLEAAILVLLITRYVRVRPHRLPWIEVMIGNHYALFALALLTGPTPVGLVSILPHRDSFEFASLLALLSGLAMVSGFFVARRVAQRFSGGFLLPKLEPDILTRAAGIHLAIAGAYVLVNVFVPATRSFLLPVANIIQTTFYETPLLVVAMSAYLAMPRPLTLVRLIIAFGVLATVTITTSMLGEMLVPLLGVAAVWWRARERVPVVLVLFVAAILLFVQPVKSHYRDLRWGEDAPDIGIIDAWQQAFAESSAQSNSSHLRSQTAVEAAVERVSELSTLAYVVELVPDTVPHTGGIIYRMLLTAVIPRVFWPDKPNMSRYAMNPFVVPLGLTTPEGAEHSGVGISIPGQGYLEHGAAGSIGWMALFGAMVGLASRYFGTTLAGTVAGAAVMGPLCTSGSTGLLGSFGSASQAIVGATLLVWFLWAIGGGLQGERPWRAHGRVRPQGA